LRGQTGFLEFITIKHQFYENIGKNDGEKILTTDMHIGK